MDFSLDTAQILTTAVPLARDLLLVLLVLASGTGAWTMLRHARRARGDDTAPRSMPDVLGTRRIHVDVGVAHGADLDRVRRILQSAAERCTGSIDRPAPAVAFVGLGARRLTFKVFAWCRSPDWRDLMHELRCNVYDDLRAAGIEVPFSQVRVMVGAHGEAGNPRA